MPEPRANDRSHGGLRVLVTGGGTGGHVAPALAVIAELRRRDGDRLVLQYVGSIGGVESRLAAEADVPFVGVASGKLRRSSKGIRGLLTPKNVVDAFRVPAGIWQARRAVRRFRPDVVLATGGYVAVPPVVASGLARIPVVIHEQTVTFGLANRIASRFARTIALSFDGAIDMVPKRQRHKVVVTGNPVRSAVLAGDRDRGRSTFAMHAEDSSLPVVFVTGGAQGSRMLNNAVRDALPELLAHAVVVHQCGSHDSAALEAHRVTLDLLQQRRWALRTFLDATEVGDAYALADVVVARSGAGTVTEVCATGRAAVFVPLVPTSHDEQTRNAKRVVDAGGAVIVTQADCSADSLLGALRPLLGSDQASIDRRTSMGAASHTLARPNAVTDLADLVERAVART